MSITFKTWKNIVVRLLIRANIIKVSTIVTQNFMKPYYDDGYTPSKAIDEEFGKNWKPSWN